MRESLLLGTRGGELRLQTAGVGFALRQLGRDLGADLAENHLQDAFDQNVRLQMIDQCRLGLRFD